VLARASAPPPPSSLYPLPRRLNIPGNAGMRGGPEEARRDRDQVTCLWHVTDEQCRNMHSRPLDRK
jgi:hypothetical protein